MHCDLFWEKANTDFLWSDFFVFVLRWFLNKSCAGSRNFLEAFKMAVENNQDITNKTGITFEHLASALILFSPNS
jgi:hypothetical protein